MSMGVIHFDYDSLNFSPKEIIFDYKLESITDRPENKRIFKKYGFDDTIFENEKELQFFLKKIISDNSNDQNVYHIVGFYKLLNQDFKNALSYFDKSLELNPSCLLPWFYKSLSFVFLDMLKKSVLCLDGALRINQHDYLSWFNKGVILSNINFHEALKCFERVLVINPDFDKGWVFKGLMFLELYKYKESVNFFKKAIELNNENQKAYLNLGLAYSLLNDHEKANETFDDALNIAPENSDFWFNKGKELSALRSYNEAQNSLNRAIQLDPYNFKAKKLLSNLYHHYPKFFRSKNVHDIGSTVYGFIKKGLIYNLNHENVGYVEDNNLFDNNDIKRGYIDGCTILDNDNVICGFIDFKKKFIHIKGAIEIIPGRTYHSDYRMGNMVTRRGFDKGNPLKILKFS